jgi:hypothetical protein
MKEIIICKTKIKDSMSEVNTRWYKEYAVFVDLTNEDFDHYSIQFGMNELYNWSTPVITASRKVTLTGENRLDGQWTLYDAFENIESASMGFGDSDYWFNAESVNKLHSQAVEKNNKMESLKKEYEGLEDLIKKTWLRESTKLIDKYNDLYADELKSRKLYSKAKKGNVPQNVIDEITSKLKPLYEKELSQIENRMIEIKKEISEI